LRGAFGKNERLADHQKRNLAMNKPQYWALAAALAVFLVLYLGFKTIPSSQQVVERSRSITGESTSFEMLLDDAKVHLSAGEAAALAELEKQASGAGSESERAEALKKMSGWWFAQGQKAVAGGIAEQVAELEETDAAWSVAGASYFEALLGEQNPKMREYCASKSVKAFESAISLAPAQVEHRVNLALVFAENPPPENPMKAVLLLRELEGKYPDSPAVYNALGRLAIKTGQWERAIERLEKSWALDPKNPNTPCLLAKAYDGAGMDDKAAIFAAQCRR
jgi:tetratricopeptide (TPR) repeat protein